MLATFGLDRLEAGLDDDTVSPPADVTAFLEQAKADCAKPAARGSAVVSYELLDDGYDDVCRESVFTNSARRLPTRVIIPPTSRIPNFGRLGTPIVCSVGTSRRHQRLD